jgi:bifunctional non-homologous end joining protein LigD
MNKNSVKIDNHVIELSHLDKKLYPKYTKEDVIHYYEKISPYFVPHVKNHLIVMHRYPDGIESKKAFYQKQIPNYFPKWIKRKEIELKKGEKQSLVLIDKTADLVFLADQAVLVLHSWLSSVPAINKPDKIVFDLDPHGKDIRGLRFAARKLKKIMEEHGLKPFIMTTGSRGYHVVAPIIAEHTFEKVHAFTRHISTQLSIRYSQDFTVEINKAKRKGRIFIDYLRNSFGQTSVAPYSLRAKEHAPVATPIHWEELGKTDPQKYTIKNIFKRLKRKHDPWKDFSKSAKKLVLDI